MELMSLRKQIDKIDKTIVEALNKRTALSLKIGKIKSTYQKVVSGNRGPLPDESIKAVYREIMSGALGLEGPVRVAYLGPAATFTHLASIKKFGNSVKHIPVNSITEVFSEVEKGRADYGVVPIENTTEGAVSHTLDMFIESDLKICSEVSLEISHNLLGNGKGRIRKVYSKPEVFGQCRVWLEANLPNIELIEVSSTARAALIAKKEKGAACIASSLAAECYGLKVLAKSIEDYSHNMTRFLVIGRTEPQPTKRDKTSIMFSIRDKIGALHDMLVPFRRNGINLTKIESRPSKKKAWDYYFFVDMIGHHKDPKIKKALQGLERQARFLKILGSYPIGKNEAGA
ncbi:MAG: prephenate dehydratase [Candidatus Omnitrophica bacterium]|nr:prephenate dehydratase [Candidatus Omnitrophota bacterium]